jgi:hypothetical protein
MAARCGRRRYGAAETSAPASAFKPDRVKESDPHSTETAISVAIRADNQAIGAVNLVWLAERQSMKTFVEEHLAQLTLAAQAIVEQFNSNARATIHSV